MRQPDPKTEFLASTEEWFRPINLTLGPDGAIYIVDMYREIIEDYSAIPRFLQQQYVESLIAGHDRGRILRLTVEGAPQRRPVDLRRASAAELVRELSNDNAWWRGDGAAAAGRTRRSVGCRAAEHVAARGPDSPGSAARPVHARRAQRPGTASWSSRRWTIRISRCGRTPCVWPNPGSIESRPLLEKVVALADDPDAKVRLQVALSLGQSQDPAALAALAHLAVRSGDEPWMNDAILSSVATTADRLLAMLVARPDGPGKAQRLLAPLASIAGARHDDEQIGRVLATLAGVQGKRPPAFKRPVWRG